MATPFLVPEGSGNRSKEAGEGGKSAVAMLNRVMVRVMVPFTTAKLYRESNDACHYQEGIQ